MNLYNLIRELLTKYEVLRSDDKKLVWAVWTKQGFVKNGSITKEDFYKAETTSTIRRTRRMVQADDRKSDNPILQPTPEVQAKRKEIEDQKGTHVYREMVEVALKMKEPEPFTPHMIFIDGLAQRCNCQIGKDHSY